MSPLATTGIGGAAVGSHVASTWIAGSWEITQGWGPSDYSGEPEGHGYAHWHAGIDVGCDCGTDLHFPTGLYGSAHWVDNPGGYGTALRIELFDPMPSPGGAPVIVQKRTYDVWLGHLRQRLVKDGQALHGGEHLAVSNNTGNSTGCHLHFEVRPAGGRYGTDVDPTNLLTKGGTTSDGSSSTGGNPYNDLDPRHGIWDLEHTVSAGITQAEATLLGVGQAALGSVMLLGGLVVVAFGLRGKSAGQLGAAAKGTVVGARRRGAQAEYGRESVEQGEIARDVAEQSREARGAAAEKAGIRRNTLGSYRAGLISRQVAQRRLGEPVRATGKRPARVAFGRGQLPGGPGVYRQRGKTIEVQDPKLQVRRSRVRLTHQRDFKFAPPAGEIPF